MSRRSGEEASLIRIKLSRRREPFFVCLKSAKGLDKEPYFRDRQLQFFGGDEDEKDVLL